MVMKFGQSMVKRLGYDIHKTENPFDDQKTLSNGSRNPIIFDVGANVGDVTAEYRKRFPTGIIYSFEPQPQEYITLSNRFKADALIHPINIALSDKETSRTLFINQIRTSSSLYKPLDEAHNAYDSPDVTTNVSGISVRTLTLNKFCEWAGLKTIDILKMDVQGSELSVLQGASGLLKRGAISVIYMEMLMVPIYSGQPHYSEIIKYLDEFDYRLFNLYHLYKSAYRKELVQCDAIFISPPAP